MFSYLLVEDLGADLAEDLALVDLLLDLPLDLGVSGSVSMVSVPVFSSDSFAPDVFSLTSLLSTMVSTFCQVYLKGRLGVVICHILN